MSEWGFCCLAGPNPAPMHLVYDLESPEFAGKTPALVRKFGRLLWPQVYRKLCRISCKV